MIQNREEIAMKRKGICLLTVLFLSGGIYGCGSEASPEEAILGGWEVVGEDDVTFTFLMMEQCPLDKGRLFRRYLFHNRWKNPL